MRNRKPVQVATKPASAGAPRKDRPPGDLLDELDRLARESDEIKNALRSELGMLLAARDELATDLMVVEREIAIRLSKVKAAAGKPPAVKRVPREKPKQGDRLPGISAAPVVPISESIQPDAIVCLIDGVRRKMLHRHLKSTYGISPEEYRAHFELPENYPMTAPGYSKSQSKAVSKAFVEGRFVPGGARKARSRQADRARVRS